MSAFARTVAPPTTAADVSDDAIAVLIALPPTTDPGSLLGLVTVLPKAIRSAGGPLFTFQTCGPDDVHRDIAAALPESARKYLPTPVMSLDEAVGDPLTDFDILVVPHITGDPPVSPKAHATPVHVRRKSYTTADTIATAPDDQLAALIAHWASVQREDATRERSLLTIGAGTLSAARAGALRRLAASIHPSMLTKLELECQAATLAANPDEERTRIIDDSIDPSGGWYVVSNGRFDVGDVPLEAPGNAIDDAVADEPLSPQTATSRRMSASVKAISGSVGRRFSRRRESISRRQSLPLSGLRVITAAEPAAATDTALYLVAAMHSLDRAREIAGGLGHDWRKGMAVGAVDV